MSKYIEEYYNKFNEDKRLLSRHGIVEFNVTMMYIKKYIKELNLSTAKILDVGAGTGRYSISLFNDGHDVTAVELVKNNLGILKAKKTGVKAYQGNALDLSRFEDNTFDITLELGPMYHLFSDEDKVKVLEEARRVTKPNGIIIVGYVMNDYAVICHGFKDGFIKEAFKNNEIDQDFHCRLSEKNLYDYVRIEDINRINLLSNSSRLEIIGVDGLTDYFRSDINKMDEETFKLYIDYQKSISMKPEFLGFSSHIIDILKNIK